MDVYRSCFIFLCFCSCYANDKPLMLTRLIESGEIDCAKEFSRVQPFNGFNYASYSGYITINSTYNQNIFFWFFLSKKGSPNAPIIQFWNGGPGFSFMFGLFGEIGPYEVDFDLKLKKREYNWVDSYNILFTDLPMGAGYSFVTDKRGYATNAREYAEQDIQFLRQFFLLFPEMRNNDFYFSPESYSGKHGVQIASLLLHSTAQQNSPLPFNFKGVILISGFIDLRPHLGVYEKHIYGLGLINERQRDILKKYLIRIQSLVKNSQWFTANVESLSVVLGSSKTTSTYFTNTTGYTDFSDLRIPDLPPIFDDFWFAQFAELPNVRQRLHVGNTTYAQFNPNVVLALLEELYKPVNIDLEYVLNGGYKVLFLDGNMDMAIIPMSQSILLNNLNWTGADDYSKANRTIWRINDNDEDIAGYITRANNLFQVTVRNAGHMIPFDQPKRTLEAIHIFICDKPLAVT